METFKEKDIVEDEKVFKKGFFIDVHWNKLDLNINYEIQKSKIISEI